MKRRSDPYIMAGEKVPFDPGIVEIQCNRLRMS